MTIVDLMHFALNQLIAYRNTNKTKEESDYLEIDIAGYQEIIDSKSGANCREFYAAKHEAIDRGERFANNLKVIEFLKANGKREV